ncbi:MAG TPA: serine protease [Stellaceae bacterium]|nr:serine protease [Stellaceae bacterium]
MKKSVALSLILSAVLALGAMALAGPARAAPVAEPAPAAAVANAESVYASARPRLLQIRTIVDAAGRQAVLGSGFLVSGDGLAITNYHVVSAYALEPKTYRLEYLMTNGESGKIELLAIDVANDLALVRIDRHDTPYFSFSERAVAGDLPKGEILYSMGNPLDLGFTIVDGTYNGAVDRTYNQRIHFSGAINPGMSGGPAVLADGKVAGINVAKELGGELVSFLVPARFAAALVERAGKVDDDPPANFTAEIGRQFRDWQAGLYASLEEKGFRSISFGHYRAPESSAPWFSCWGRTNVDDVPKPRATVNASLCNSDTQLFIANDLNTGRVRLMHIYVKSDTLNEFQFAAFLSQQLHTGFGGGYSRKWHTQERCEENFVAAEPADKGPTLRTVWCARAYREFPDLYDVNLTAVTQDDGREALVSTLAMQGVLYDNAISLGKKFIEALQWTK